MKKAFVAIVRSAQNDFASRFDHLPKQAKTDVQRNLQAKHGSPYEFAVACSKAVGDFISIEEAEDSIQKYIAQWKEGEI